jgi:hypothetical protein
MSWIISSGVSVGSRLVCTQDRVCHPGDEYGEKGTDDRDDSKENRAQRWPARRFVSVIQEILSGKPTPQDEDRPYAGKRRSALERRVVPPRRQLAEGILTWLRNAARLPV